MKAYHWLLGLVGAGVLVFSGCSTETFDPGYHLDNPNASAAGARSGSAKDFMLAAGCVALTGDPHIGVVRITTPTGAVEKFDCVGLTRGRVRQAFAQYREALAKALHVTFIVSNQGGYYYAGNASWCAPPSQTSITNIAGYAHDGTPYDADSPVAIGAQPGTCYSWEVWLLDTGGDPGDNSPVGTPLGGSTQITPIAPWKVMPILPADSCRSGDPHMSGRPTSEQGPLNSRSITDGFNALLVASQAAPPTELARAIILKADGTYVLDSSTLVIYSQDNCDVKFGINTNVLPAGEVLVGWVHTHPYVPGTFAHCRNDTAHPNSTSKMVNVSNLDWGGTMTNYVVGTDSIFRLDPGLSPTQQLTPPSWGRVTNGCPTTATN